MFGRLLVWYTTYTFSGALAPRQNFARCKIDFISKSCVRLYWQHYRTALQQRASAKFCVVVQGTELRNFRRGHHLYSAGRPSRWASAHILVIKHFERQIISACTVVEMDKFWPPPSGSKTHERNSMKVGMCKYVAGIITHANLWRYTASTFVTGH